MKTLKKRPLIILTLFLALGGLFLHWRRNVAYSQEELLALARKEAGIPGSADVTLLGDYGSYDHPVLCLTTRSGDCTFFYTVSFDRLWWWGLGGWGNAHDHILINRGPNMYTTGDLSFLFSDNPENAFIRLGTEVLPVTEYPFCHRVDLDSCDSFSYDFLDKNGRSLIN